MVNTLMEIGIGHQILLIRIFGRFHCWYALCPRQLTIALHRNDCLRVIGTAFLNSQISQEPRDSFLEG